MAWGWGKFNSLATTSLAARVELTLFTDEAQDAHQQVYGDQPHEGKLSHEVLAGGAAFAGFKLYEDHQRKEGSCHLDTTHDGIY